MMLTSTPIPSKSSDKSCKRTIFNRNKFLQNIIKTTSGASNEAKLEQTSKLLSSLDTIERQKLLSNAKIPTAEIPEEFMVALKVEMSIPWEKLKTMSRWVKLTIETI